MFASLVINNDGRLRLSNIDLLQLLKELFFVLPPAEQAAFLHHLFTADLTKEAAAELNRLFDDCQLPPVASTPQFVPSREFFGFDQAAPAPAAPELMKSGPVTQPRYIRAPQFDRRIGRGDDFAGDGWIDCADSQKVIWTAVGHRPEGAANG